MLFKEIISENWKPNKLLKQISVIAILKNLGNNAQRASKKWKSMIYLEFNWRMPKKKNSVALFRERTIPTERPPPVGEVSANFCG